MIIETFTAFDCHDPERVTTIEIHVSRLTGEVWAESPHLGMGHVCRDDNATALTIAKSLAFRHGMDIETTNED